MKKKHKINVSEDTVATATEERKYTECFAHKLRSGERPCRRLKLRVCVSVGPSLNTCFLENHPEVKAETDMTVLTVIGALAQS